MRSTSVYRKYGNATWIRLLPHGSSVSIVNNYSAADVFSVSLAWVERLSPGIAWACVILTVSSRFRILVNRPINSRSKHLDIPHQPLVESHVWLHTQFLFVDHRVGLR